MKESYRLIEGGLIKSAKRAVLILQNASKEACGFAPTQGKPSRVELLVTPDLTPTTRAPAEITTLDPNAPIVLPPLSIARIIWE